MQRLAAMTLMIALLISGCTADAPNTTRAAENENSSTSRLTPEDVAWATGWKIWKFDLSDVRPVHGYRLIVLDHNDQQIASAGTHIVQNYPADAEMIVRVAMRKDGSTISGQFAAVGASMAYRLEDLFDPQQLALIQSPPREDDRYYLAADSRDIRGIYEPREGVHRIALEILRDAPE